MLEQETPEMKNLTTTALTLALTLSVSPVLAQVVESPALVLPRKLETPEVADLESLAPVERPGSQTFNPQWQSFDEEELQQGLRPNDPFLPFALIDETDWSRGSRGMAVQDPFAILHEEMEQMQRLQDNMRQQMNTMMSTMPGTHVQSFSTSTSGGELTDAGDHYRIDLQMTGLDQGSTSLSVEGNQLVLRCAVQQTTSNTQGTAQIHSSFTNHIERRWTLPGDANGPAFESDFDEDRIEITIPKIPGLE